MPQLTIIEFFVRVIPETIIFLLSIYFLSDNKIDKNKFIFTTILASMFVFFIRLLPIHYGVHTILNMIVLIVLANLINKIDLVSNIRATLITVIFLFISEGINLFLIQYVFNKDINVLFNNSIEKILYGIPSLFLTLFLVISYCKLTGKNKNLKLKGGFN